MKLQYVSILRTWLALVALMALGNAVQCFVDPRFMKIRVYVNASYNYLSSRVFGWLTLILGILRFCCAIDIYNQTLYYLTMFSFAIVIGHLLSEVYYFKTAVLSSAVLVQLTISGISMAAMLIRSAAVKGSTEVQEDFSNNRITKRIKQKTS